MHGETAERSARLVCSRCGSRRPYVSLIGPDRLDADDLRRANVGGLQSATAPLWKGGKECAMPYCITLRSRTDAVITGWYSGGYNRWSTDHERQKLFGNKTEARAVWHELRSLYPRSAKVIKIEVTQDEPPPKGGAPDVLVLGKRLSRGQGH